MDQAIEHGGHSSWNFPLVKSAPLSSLKPIHFILGTGRSGTTLLRVMLAGHPQIFCPPEMMLAFFENMQQRKSAMDTSFWLKGGLRRAMMDLENLSVEEAKKRVNEMTDQTIEEVYAELQSLCGGRTIVDKCPPLSYLPETLNTMPMRFPEARYIWLVRHPGSVIRSFGNMPMAEVMLKGLPGVESTEDAWRLGNANLRDFLKNQSKDKWLMVRYEDLVQNPQSEMEKILNLLGMEWDDAVLVPYEGDRMREGPAGARAIGDPNMANRGKIDPGLADKWLRGFDPRSVSSETKELALDLGYDLSELDLPPIAHVSDAMNALWDTAKRLESEISLPMDLDAVEGRRFLLRMISESVDTFVEYIDADNPSFRHAEGPHRKMFGDCPDADYLQTPINLKGNQVYRLSGRIPEGTTYVGILLYGKGGRVGSSLTDKDLDLDSDDKFEILISADPESNPTLLGEGDEHSVMVRQYYSDRNKEDPVAVDIELVGESPKPKPLDPDWMTKRLNLSKRMLEAIFERTLETYKMVSPMALNHFVRVPADRLFPTPDNDYQVCWYRFGRDQLMFVRGKIPEARYFSFTLYNAWMESYDYTRHQVILNHSQINTDKDGEFEICLAHRDLSHPNWLDTAGHRAGYLVARSLLPEGEPTEFKTQVMYETEWSGLKK